MNLEIMPGKNETSHDKNTQDGDRSQGQLVQVSEVWLICAPGANTPKATWDSVNKATLNLSTNFKFPIPELKARIYICTVFICLLQLSAQCV